MSNEERAKKKGPGIAERLTSLRNTQLWRLPVISKGGFLVISRSELTLATPIPATRAFIPIYSVHNLGCHCHCQSEYKTCLSSTLARALANARM